MFDCCLFWCQSFGEVFMFVHYTFSKVSVAEWPPFGKYQVLGWPFVLIVFCLFCILFISHFGFKSECHHNARARGDQPCFRR